MPPAAPPAPDRPARPRWAVLVFLLAFTAGVVVLCHAYLLPALQTWVDARQRGDKAGARAISATAYILLGVLLFILFCGLVLTFRVGRLFFPRNQGPRTKTQYVDAWAESGKRMETPDAKEDEDGR
jgi:hypothetical protein